MNLKELTDAKNANTGKASDVVRQSVLAGVAVIWLLRNEHAVVPLNRELLLCLFWFGLSLAADVIQYLFMSTAWVVYLWSKLAEKVGDATEFQEPKWVPRTGYCIFWLKIILAIVGWFFLAKHLLHAWHVLG